jgi:threonine dehydrogenase-like Zn-dependent dehydrogenase
MRALRWHGKHDIRCDTVPDPTIEEGRDAIIKVSTCAICGSDLHLFDGFMPTMESGDIMGHEFMGEVVEVGKDNKALRVGDRVVIPFTIFCGECDQCKRGNFSVCERSNRNKERADKVFGHATAGLFGYSHLTGGYAGGQAEYVRVPMADTTHVKIPDGLTDEQVLFLGDIFPTGWQAAVNCDIQPDDTVAIWGAGPVGQMAIRSAVLLGAKQVVVIDRVPERLAMAKEGGAITINFDEESVLDRLKELTNGKGPEKCIDAVGMESHATRSFDAMYDRVKQAVMLESDRPHVLREMIYVCRPAGILSVPGVYGGLIDKIPFWGFDEQGADLENGPDACEPMDRRFTASNPGGPDRSIFRDHAHGPPGRRSGHVQDIPRQGRRLHQGCPQTVADSQAG